jgi:hypothetical protein
MYYNVNDIQKMTTNFILSPLILNEIHALENLIIVATKHHQPQLNITNRRFFSDSSQFFLNIG